MTSAPAAVTSTVSLTPATCNDTSTFVRFDETTLTCSTTARLKADASTVSV
jgi:hypothetical protein